MLFIIIQFIREEVMGLRHYLLATFLI